MPIINEKDASDVLARIGRVFNSAGSSDRSAELRRLFVEVLDFEQVFGLESPLHPSSTYIRLPETADIIATADDVVVAYVDLSLTELTTNRVRLAEAADVCKQLESDLGGDVLLVFSNKNNDQLHFIWPDFQGQRPTLRRIVVERDLPMRTAVQQLSNLYWRWQETKNLVKALDLAFNVEAVTTAFFREYRSVFDAAKDLVSCNVGSLSDEDKHVFVQTLFNRLMFVYFLSRKGWLRFNDDKDYLNALWKDYEANPSQTNFYRDRLSHLFFAGLNNPNARNIVRDNALLHAVIGDVPFLNGGLFTKHEVRDRDGAFDVPDDAILPLLERVFDSFNFTVLESTPFDIEVAVDPEMLGKVFEETVNARHESGAFYTPRPVVTFMCREALKTHLAGKVDGFTDPDMTKFVDALDVTGMGVSQARQMAAALHDVTVVDPACGSGAYLLGMMQELVALQTELYNVDAENVKDIYDLKLDIIQRNLFGADLDEFAVNIAMLRLWLSLTVEYDGDNPEPLPNLDYQILCGDSLTAPDPSPANYGDLFRNKAHLVAAELDRCKSDYLKAYGDHKNSIKERIEALVASLRDSLNNGPVPSNAVDWRIRFPEVFDRNGGFDIAIANPPYVRQENFGDPVYKGALRSDYGDAVTGQSDLYCYFYVRGLQLLSNGGIHLFISSNSWLDVKYGEELKQYLTSNSTIRQIFDSAVERQFTTAQINTIISDIEKVPPGSAEGNAAFIVFNAPFNEAIRDETLRDERRVRPEELNPADKWGGIYLRSPGIYHRLLHDRETKFTLVEEVAKVNRGKTTGANDFFVLNAEAQAQWNIEPEFLKPVMRQARHYQNISVNLEDTTDAVFMCDLPMDDLTGTNTFEYIRYGESKGYHTRKTCSSRPLWYNLLPMRTFGLAMMYQTGATFRTYRIIPDMHCIDIMYTLECPSDVVDQLCASMNSAVGQLEFTVNGRANLGGGMLEIKAYEVKRSYVVRPDLLPAMNVGEFGRVKWDILNPSQEQQELDHAVFDALRLTSDERDDVYASLVKLAEERTRKSRSTSNQSVHMAR